MIISLLACFLPIATGFVLITLLLPEYFGSRSTILFKILIAIGVSLGILSCSYFLQLSILGTSRQKLILTQVVLFGIVSVLCIYRMRLGRSQKAQNGAPQHDESRYGRILAILFALALLSTVVTLLYISLRMPHGEWDAWAVYNMKARFLFRAGEHWRDLFSAPMEWAGPDYPLMIPAAITAYWTLIGKETLIVPVVVAILFTVGTIGITTYSVAVLRGRTQGLLAGLVLLGTQYLTTHGADQYSDIPIGYFFVATISLLILQAALGRSDGKFLILAGLTAGLSAWTKNEGNLFVIAVACSQLALIPRNGWKTYLKQMRFFLAGLLPILAVVIYFKLTISAHSGLLFPAEGPSLIAKVTDVSRYRTILDFFIRRGLAFGSWPSSIVPLLAFYLLLLGIRIPEEERPSIIGSLIMLGIMFAGYFMIYVISPRDLEWHITTSLDRLYSQLWPCFVLTFFLIVRTPDQVLSKREILPETS